MVGAQDVADCGGRMPPGAGEAFAHPEEIKAAVDLRIGDRVLLNATARITPAGLVTAGFMVSTVLLTLAFLVRTARRPA